MNRTHPIRCHKSAFTLLEVILALSILAGAIAVLGEVMSIAGRNAADARAEAQAQLLASSVMDEMLSGMTERTELMRQPLVTDTAIPWVYSVTFGTTNVAGLSSVEVLVEQDVEKQFRPVQYRLVRWLPADSDSPDQNGDSDDGPTETGERGSNA